jgi:hypothetical protein
MHASVICLLERPGALPLQLMTTVYGVGIQLSETPRALRSGRSKVRTEHWDINILRSRYTISTEYNITQIARALTEFRVSFYSTTVFRVLRVLS